MVKLMRLHSIVIVPKVFGNMKFEPDTEYNRHNNFQTFVTGLSVLFR